ncbi:MAG: DUF1134 domain-containing protein [Alphaproteobacteria bacterium]|nr:DUF1134 domain-containing protein [Alphaproteobacteria bacterium]
MSNDTESRTRRAITRGLAASAAAGALGIPAARAQEDPNQTYSEDEIVNAASRFFGLAAEAVAQAVRPIFADLGRPVGFVEGSEGSGAFAVGLRYGEGRLYFQRGADTTKIFWQGPSIGFDTGANASKVFTLVYGMTDPRQIFRRFPGVEGTAYFIGGIGVNYQRAEGITLAPMRAGVGLRLGANLGYLAYSPRRNWIPF